MSMEIIKKPNMSFYNVITISPQSIKIVSLILSIPSLNFESIISRQRSASTLIKKKNYHDVSPYSAVRLVKWADNNTRMYRFKRRRVVIEYLKIRAKVLTDLLNGRGSAQVAQGAVDTALDVGGRLVFRRCRVGGRPRTDTSSSREKKKKND